MNSQEAVRSLVRSLLENNYDILELMTLKRFLQRDPSDYRKLGHLLSPYQEGDCAGPCALVSHAVHKHLQKLGVDSHFVTGSYNPWGQHNYAKDWNSHAWVVSGKHIIDLAHDQYDPEKPFEVRKITDERYKEFERDDDAYKVVKGWGKESNPSDEIYKKHRWELGT
jgi:hypothetical protein